MFLEDPINILSIEAGHHHLPRQLVVDGWLARRPIGHIYSQDLLTASRGFSQTLHRDGLGAVTVDTPASGVEVEHAELGPYVPAHYLLAPGGGRHVAETVTALPSASRCRP